MKNLHQTQLEILAITVVQRCVCVNQLNSFEGVSTVTLVTINHSRTELVTKGEGIDSDDDWYYS